jgi:hypothetical protein
LGVADFETEKIKVTRTRYVLTTPSNAAELSKMIAAAANEYRDTIGEIADDSLNLETEDDKIVIWWEVEDAG